MGSLGAGLCAGFRADVTRMAGVMDDVAFRRCDVQGFEGWPADQGCGL